MDRSRKRLVIFTDCGDTIVDESTQVLEEGFVLRAEPFDRAAETLRLLHQEGHIIALVADGHDRSFRNILGELNLLDVFSAWAVSSEVGEEKPSPRMFAEAFRQLGLTEEDKPRVIMVGNNVRKDIAGANRFGLTSVLLDLSPRYDMAPSAPDEVPDHVIHEPHEILALAGKLEKELEL